MRHPRVTASEALHAEIGHILFGIRDATDSLISIRTREHGMLLDGEIEELTVIKENLDWLLADIKQTKAA